ncbi:MAG: hypothetical protein ACR2RA_25340 [Geminicoccaceae bacterium]
MTVGSIAVSTPALALTGLYAALALLLLSLHLKSGWSWWVKSAAMALAVPATAGAFAAIHAQLGWPSPSPLPAHFQLHAALIEEPAIDAADEGAIYLWLTPWEDVQPMDQADIDAAILPNRRPRAFDLPYSRELHQKVETMRERLARGELVTGRHEPGRSWDRRFNRQDGAIDLEAPPAPPLPSKDD